MNSAGYLAWKLLNCFTSATRSSSSALRRAALSFAAQFLTLTWFPFRSALPSTSSAFTTAADAFAWSRAV
jgi:hypothetical protein